MEHDKEEGEMSDDHEMLIDDQPLDSPTKSTVVFIADKNGLLVQQLEKVDACRLEERAKRFGLNLTGNRIVTQKQIDELYNNFGIEGGNERHFRFDTLHLNGVNGLITKDIFEYLVDYKPVSLEWVDDNSCNVVCQDHISAALALLVHSREIKSEHIKDMLQKKSSHYWREGVPHPNKDLILMRFATNSDKKSTKVEPEQKHRLDSDKNINNEGKNPWGDLCRSWGIYDHQEVFQRNLSKTDYEEELEEPFEKVQVRNKKLASRLGKRNHSIEVATSDSDSEWKKKSKTPRMRMRADDEESKQKNHNQTKQNDSDEDDYAPLSIEILNSSSKFTSKHSKRISEKFRNSDQHFKSMPRNVHSRLGIKVVDNERSYSDESSSNESDYNVTSRVQKVTTGSKNTSNVWSRLEIKPKNSGQKDLRQILTTRKPKHKDDLRDRLGKSKQCNIRIEIDNS
ncbi:nuclear cap-binding protein subunit 3-like [Danaus plexippus]|uniref:Nuclear cap-binding protein subunit 3 n=1 Tax=Danaus plexippus plexippus TaxID=278856 RepID=A0A212ERS9_DANPL|nr:nuclear cap-binding protein subunit 3-like [Danaus plexippus]OWR44169.1 hypothetical protein KGM_203051 [Danaus plexippus plexippus]